MEKGLYRHFKGGLYIVINTALHSETMEEFVIYHNADKPEQLWVRPLKMFTEIVVVENTLVQRFRLESE